jgi:hypothetical protein
MRSILCWVAGAALLWACGGVAVGGALGDGGGSTSGGSNGGASSSGSGGGSSGSSSSGSGSGGSSGSSGAASSTGSSGGASSGSHGSSGSSGGGASSGSSGGGGSSGSTGSSGAAGSSSGSGGSSGMTGSPACPPTPPTSKSKCPILDAQCEYGGSPSPSCNQLFSCAPDGWRDNGPAMCAMGTCPASYSDIKMSATCVPVGLDCAYSEGQCNCSYALPAGTGQVWRCFTPPVPCPEPRPMLGSACSQPGLMCDYGVCEGAVAMTCLAGYWNEQAVACPALATSR